jgi:hypothetical protein
MTSRSKRGLTQQKFQSSSAGLNQQSGRINKLNWPHLFHYHRMGLELLILFNPHELIIGRYIWSLGIGHHAIRRYRHHPTQSQNLPKLHHVCSTDDLLIGQCSNSIGTNLIERSIPVICCQSSLNLARMVSSFIVCDMISKDLIWLKVYYSQSTETWIQGIPFRTYWKTPFRFVEASGYVILYGLNLRCRSCAFILRSALRPHFAEAYWWPVISRWIWRPHPRGIEFSIGSMQGANAT